MKSTTTNGHLNDARAIPRLNAWHHLRPRPVRPRRLPRVIEYACWFLGCATLAWLLAVILRTDLLQHSQSARLDNQRQPDHSAKTPQPGDPLGRLSIPRISLSAMIVENTDDETLRYAIGHIPGTSSPDSTGNIGLAAHRDTFFRNLGRLRQNDLIFLETPKGKYQYKVVSTAVVGPKHVEVLRSSGNAGLTLVTCFPFHYIGPAPDRFVVQAARINGPG